MLFLLKELELFFQLVELGLKVGLRDFKWRRHPLSEKLALNCRLVRHHQRELLAAFGRLCVLRHRVVVKLAHKLELLLVEREWDQTLIGLGALSGLGL